MNKFQVMMVDEVGHGVDGRHQMVHLEVGLRPTPFRMHQEAPFVTLG